MHIKEEQCPKVMSARNLRRAVILHVGVWLFFLVLSIPFRSKEEVIPIDLTVVVQENLDGNENEPPPLDKPAEVKPPEPEPKPVKPEPPPVVEDAKVDAVVKEKKPEKPKVEKKPEEKKEPEKPKKTKEQLRKERQQQMLKDATLVKDSGKKPQPNGRTDKATISPEEARKLLNQGYKPGTSDQLATDEKQRCISLIQKAFYDKWERPPWSSSLKEMLLDVTFDSAGHVKSHRLTGSSGDKLADNSVLNAASRVEIVYGLTPAFLKKNSTVTIRFKVTPQ